MSQHTKSIMIQGTMSNAGKSILAAGPVSYTHLRWKENEENYREKKSHTSNGLHGCVCGNTDCHESKDKKNNNIRGIFFNRMSPMIYNRIKPMVEELFRIPVIGYLPELNFLHVGSRHLGLVLPDEIDGIREQLEQLADRMDENLEWEPLLKLSLIHI